MPDTEEVKPETTTEAAAPQSADKAVAETPDTTVEAATSEAADPAAVIADLQNRLAQAEAQAAEYKDQWMRAVADYRNFKRRTETERTELVRNAGAALILKLLPVLDDFERAIANIPPDIAETPWWQGTQLIAQKLRTILESEGVKPIEALGQEFNPNLHEAVIYEDAEGQEGKVIAELQRGYLLHDRVIRPSMVKVGRG
ncbi:MAG TPA: nucleotide exchange factor GrpE [Chloroflexus aurantiacus]|jgi:molecular chaperone GrpE|uniref:Protein GrpE n=1 Tax=Chloroflexus aurantiacus (strain ATCC 29366 / DSM 635 / J-10-fl) TaxID=324602 RepID=A9WEX2_CHLAA|nr:MULTISPECIES: nucleotide exchange factor GrpE [Chloroflexus]ABY35287.1 GrpE protein [Chloroflexus aurantiacus J-10-fl]RMG50086.1 MAG: nucleotide exchange factor GrpE [Chloroflexota bacterium]HBW65925.1 nucleotide exchange factor GrpE [Chloroflexus aurantiacus]